MLVGQTDPLGAQTRYVYDEQGRLITVVNALEQTTQLRYDERHQLAHIITPDEQIRSRGYDALGRLTTLTDPMGAVQVRRYDRSGQLVQLTEPDGTQQTLVYDGVGNVIEARQSEQLVTFTYTGQSRLSQRRQAGQQVGFSYDKEGRLTGLTNEAGLLYRFGLDANGQVVEEEGFDGLLRRYERDAAGRVTTVLRPADRYTTYAYSPTGQIRTVQYSDGTTERYDYDEVGALIRAENEATTVRLERDALGRVRWESQGEHWVEYSYDALGQRTQVRSSLGADLALAYDALGNVRQMAAGSWQARFGYDSRGLEVQRTLSGNLQIGWQRDAAGRPTQQRITAGSHATRQRTYQWQTGDILSQIEDSMTGITRYEHDVFGALTNAHYGDGSQEVRRSDAVGNLYESEAKDDRQYGPGGQLLSSREATYHYDAEGNLTQKMTRQGEVWHYEWAGNGMLTSVLRPDGHRVSFTYDALGRRLSKRYKGKTTYWLWEGNKPLHEWAELGLDGTNTEAIITWLFEENSFAPIGKLQGASRQSILTDHLGTPLDMVDQGGQRTWSAQTTAYGRVRIQEGTRAACPFRFQGQYEDVETGLYYNRFRYYDPQQGGYVSQDPIGLKGGMGLYSYVENPATWKDVAGLSGMPSFDELKQMAQTTLDFSTSKDGAVFWSGKNMNTAQEWAKRVGKTTLEQTVGGKYLDELKLFENLPGKQAAEIWDIASKRFAESASGTVSVFSTGAKKIGDYGMRTWWRIEKPALLKNSLVSSIIRMRKDGLPVGSVKCK
ncbi:RHS repeat-associated core domain-containing protein [Fibrella musci]|uniref:RHS repeat-associated core domain-containing protein n=1 Tax=Fibrella musci TaxID=3242485 RepID=UPI003F8EB7D0